MDVASIGGLLAVAVLVLANGFFVATEFAIVAIRRSRLEQLVKEGRSGAAAAKEVVGRLDTYIAACQLGITLASLALGWIGEPALARLIEPPLERLVGSFAPAASHGVAVGVAFTLITALHIVIGELAPKGLALQRTESTVLWIARPIKIFYLIFKWPIILLNAIGNGALRLINLRPATAHEMAHSISEVRLLVNEMGERGVIELSEAKIASRALEFADLTADTLMTHRRDVEALPIDLSRDELIMRVKSATHSRLPVYKETLDDIVGIFHARDVFKVLDMKPGQFRLKDLLRPALQVPESKPADALLEDMRAVRAQLAVVVDEYGGTAGIVTIEDVVEALVGRIGGEAAGGDDMKGLWMKQEPDGSLLLSGAARLSEVEEATGLNVDDDDLEATTLGGLVMEMLGRVPRVNDQVNIEGRIFRVEALDGLRVARVRILSPVKEPSQTARKSDS
jgi:CBS domain containing-hemolysin-like protein